MRRVRVQERTLGVATARHMSVNTEDKSEKSTHSRKGLIVVVFELILHNDVLRSTVVTLKIVLGILRRIPLRQAFEFQRRSQISREDKRHIIGVAIVRRVLVVLARVERR